MVNTGLRARIIGAISLPVCSSVAFLGLRHRPIHPHSFLEYQIPPCRSCGACFIAARVHVQDSLNDHPTSSGTATHDAAGQDEWLKPQGPWWTAVKLQRRRLSGSCMVVRYYCCDSTSRRIPDHSSCEARWWLWIKLRFSSEDAVALCFHGAESFVIVPQSSSTGLEALK